MSHLFILMPIKIQQIIKPRMLVHQLAFRSTLVIQLMYSQFLNMQCILNINYLQLIQRLECQ